LVAGDAPGLRSEDLDEDVDVLALGLLEQVLDVEAPALPLMLPPRAICSAARALRTAAAADAMVASSIFPSPENTPCE
jgi:hypothetical protein